MKKAITLLCLFVYLQTNAQTFLNQWAQSMHAATGSACFPKDMVRDPSGNIIVVGDFRGTIDFDPSGATANLATTNAANDRDGFIAKYDSSGNYLWALKLGVTGTTNEGLLAVETDTSGGIYVGGYNKSSTGLSLVVTGVTGSGATLTGYGNNGILLKYTAAGAYVWGRTIGNTGIVSGDNQEEQVWDIKMSRVSGLYVCGEVDPGFDFDPGAGSNTNTYHSSFFASYDAATGAYNWAKFIHSGFNNAQYAGLNGMHSITSDTNDNIYVAGYYTPVGSNNSVTNTDFDPSGSTFNVADTVGANSFVHRMFIAKYTNAGAFIWVSKIKGYNATGNSWLDSRFTDIKFNNNQLVASLHYLGNFQPIGGNNAASNGGIDNGIVSYNATTGAFQWLASYGSSSNDYCYGLTLNPTNNQVYVAGSFAGNMNLGGPILSNSGGGADSYILTCNSSGTLITAISFGGSGADGLVKPLFTAPNFIHAAGFHTGSASISVGNSKTLTGISTGTSFSLLKYSFTCNNPTVTTQPTSSQLCANVNASMSVAFSGASSYQWYRNGTAINGETFVNYNFIPTINDNGAKYYVKGTNGCGSTTSDTITLAVTPATSVTLQPVGTTACAGSTVKFFITAAGANLTYQWRKGLVNIPSATTDTLTLTNVQPGDAGGYNCVVTGTCGTATSNNGILSNIFSKATITWSLAPTLSLCAGANYTFTPNSVSGSAVTYQWQKDNANINLATSITYALTSVTTANNGVYRLIAFASCGNDTSDEVTLTVTGAAAMTQQPQAQTVCTGDTISLPALATGSNLVYQWRRASSNLNGQSNPTLVILNASSANAGLYDVVVTSSCGTTTSNQVNVTVTAPLQGSFARAICTGQTFNFNGQTLSQPGAYKDTIKTPGGCDSIITLNLTLASTLQGSFAQTICTGKTFTFNGQTLSQSGTYKDTVQTSGGCDSIITLNLTVAPVLQGSFAQTICTGKTFTFNGQTLSQSGAYKDTVQTSSGCDSIITLNLTVTPALQSSFSETVCNGDSYTFNGQTLTQGGVFKDTVQTSGGCDSIVTLNLTVLNKIENTINAGICTGQSYPFKGQQLAQDGQYFDTLQTAMGCDSFITLNLTVNSFVTGSVNAEICQGLSYTFNGQTLTQDGQYNDTLTSVGGCDSIVTLTLVVNDLPQPTITQNGNVLSTQTFDNYQWQLSGSDINNATSQSHTAVANGNYTVLVTDSNGCSAFSPVFNVTGVGIDDVRLNDIRFAMYPNPTSSVLNIESDEEIQTVEVTDLTGRIILSHINLVTRNLKLATDMIAEATYFIRLTTTKGKTAVKSFVKQ